MKALSPAKAGWDFLGVVIPGLTPGATNMPPLRGLLTDPTRKPMAGRLTSRGLCRPFMAHLNCI